MLLIPWALYLWVAGSGGTGAKTVAADFLSSRSAGRLSERTRRFIEACCTEPVSFWQAEAVEPGVGMSMREMATGRECFVYERTGSATLVPWDVMFSQVVAVDGVHCFSISGPYILPAASFRLQVERFLEEAIDATRLRDHSRDLIDYYLDCVDELLEPQRPEVRNTEGDRLVWTESTYSFNPAERGRVLGRLDQMRNFEAAPSDEGHEEFLWVSQRKDSLWSAATRARLKVLDETLVTEANSTKRDRLLRKRLLKALDDLLVYEQTDRRPLDKDTLFARGDMGDTGVGTDAPKGSTSGLDLDQLPPEARDQLRDMMDGIQMRWADETVPALGNQTPREAAKTASGRTQVAHLLNDFETHQRRAPNPQHTFDYNKLRRELGLEEE
jgi:hypothetical protein